MSLRKIFMVGCLMSAVSLPLSALAGVSLTIDNQTNFDSASIVNGSLCTNKIPIPGNVTKAHTVNTISSVSLYIACHGNEANCTAEIYGNATCSQPNEQNPIGKIGTAIVDTSSGLKSVTVTDPRFTETHDATHVSIMCAASNPELCS